MNLIAWKAGVGYLLRHPWQLAMTILGISLGVAVVVAVDLANSSSRKAFAQAMDAVNGAATHQIVGGPAGIDERIYATLRREGGMRRIAPIVAGDGDIGAVTVYIMGVDFFAESSFRNFSRSSGSEFTRPQALIRTLITEPGAVTMSDATAASLDLKPGQRFALIVNGKTTNAVVAGVFDDSSESGIALRDVLVADIATAQEWFRMHGRLSRIDVIAEGNPGDAGLQRIRGFLTPDLQLLDADGRTQATLDMAAAFKTNLTAMSLLALLVGVFLIYNSVSFAVLQRRQLIGVLRALGVTRGEILLLILAEALALGIVGAILGIGLGLWLGESLLGLVAQSLNDLYFRVAVTSVSASSVTLAKGLAIAVVATLFAALAPAIEAMTYPPRLSMLRTSLEQRLGVAVPRLAWSGIGCAVVAGVAIAVSGTSLVAGLAALFVVVMGLALIIPLALQYTGYRLGRARRPISNLQARLGFGGAAYSISRTGVAAAAMAIALATTVGVNTMVGSFRAAVTDWLDHTLQSDLYVSVTDGRIMQELAAAIPESDGVLASSSARRVVLESPQGPISLVAIESAGQGRGKPDIVDGDAGDAWEAFNGNAVLLSESYAFRYGLQRGDELMLRTRNGEESFPVAGVFRSYGSGQGYLLMTAATFLRWWDDPGISTIGLYLDERADADDIIASIRAASDGKQSLRVRSNAELRQLSLKIFDQTFVITDVLFWLALAIAVAGILGAMLATQFERSRELATLRAIGMTPWQTGQLVLAQTGFIGLVSGLAAVPLGLVMAWMLIRVINLRSFGWSLDLTVSTPILIAIPAVAVSVALLAGVYPAWRAARASPALAMREE
ncbi:MAG: FtsX-like permease family protein [Gammaproteobacteria bacterium]|nr:FtsX-like permease family protein [Gammaproteobacteria bacterium]